MTTMTNTKLRDLRRRLDDLHRSRETVRLGSAWSATLIAVCWSIVVLFLIDFRFELSGLQRLCMLAVAAGAVYWTFRRYTEPMLGTSEDQLDIALMVERQQGIDSDLVAALQFEQPEAEQWGSEQLEGAVVDYVADFSKGLNIFEGFSREQLFRRAGTLLFSLAVIGGAIWVFPQHAGAFFNRMVLGAAHYPTKTNIVQVEINGTDLGPDPARRQPVKSPFGRPVQFRIHVEGDIPQIGQVVLRTSRRNLQTNIELRPAEGASMKAGQTIFVGSLSRLVDPVDYQLFVGDDWTDPAGLVVTPLPVVDVQPQVTPPPYAQVASEELESAEGARQISVIEGSQIVLNLTSDKPLKEAVLTIGDQKLTFAKEKKKKGGLEQWTIDPAGTPLARVTEAFQYEVNVVDKDGLSLESPIKGYVRIKVDRQPRVQADVITRFVLPAANPTINFAAVDDYGVAQIKVLREVIRGSEAKSLGAVQIPVKEPSKALRDTFSLNLSGLNLAKGDKLRITLEATDYRGDVAGKTSVSEPVVLQVTDKQGLLQAMLESDRKSDKQLDAIIQRQLGISGESR